MRSSSRELDEGESVTLRILRDTEVIDVTLVARTVEFPTRVVTGPDWSENFHFRVAPGKVWQSGGPWFLPLGWLGMQLVEINPELGEYFGSDTGVLVVRGPECDETLGLASGDVIFSIGNREVKDPEHVMRILRSYEPGEELSVDISIWDETPISLVTGWSAEVSNELGAGANSFAIRHARGRFTGND